MSAGGVNFIQGFWFVCKNAAAHGLDIRELRRGREGSVPWLVHPSVLDAQNVLVPDVAGEGAAVADVQTVVVAKVEPSAELGIDDGVAGGVLNRFTGQCVGLFAVENGPADELDDRCNVDA